MTRAVNRTNLDMVDGQLHEKDGSCATSGSKVMTRAVNTTTLDMVDGQLHEKDGSCATSGSNVMIRAVNKLKMRSKTDEVVSVALKINKACL